MLELWEDTRGPDKGIKCFRGRWLFYPHHLPEDHKEKTRKRSGLELRQVYEQCGVAANDEENPLASVRSLQRVLCCWKDIRNREPSKEELQAAHAWFDSAWDDKLSEVVPLGECVDKAGSGACRRRGVCPASVLTPRASAARFALIRALEIVQPPTPAPVVGAMQTAAGTPASGAPEQPDVAAAAVHKVQMHAAAAAAKPPASAPRAEKPKAEKVSDAPLAPPKAAATAEAVPKSSATAAAPADPARKVAAPSACAVVAEKRALAPAVAAIAVPRAGPLPAAVTQGEAPQHGSKPGLPSLPPPAKKPAAVGDKRSRQEAVPTVEEHPAKRVAVRACASCSRANLFCINHR